MMNWRQMFGELMIQSDRVQTSVYFPKEIDEALVRWAQEEDRPISNLVVRIVSKAVSSSTPKSLKRLNHGLDGFKDDTDANMCNVIIYKQT